MNTTTNQKTSEINSHYPLYSLVIITYNQEKFIRQTLHGAFAQTYPNLEIIVSDDGSSDHTWEILSEEVRQYTGPHKVIINRNEKNLGMGANVTVGVKLSHGEVIVWNEGDDISTPNRVMLTWKTFEKYGKDTMVVIGRPVAIDAEGNSIQVKYHKKYQPSSLNDVRSYREIGPGAATGGATSAYRREVVEFFGPPPSNFLAGDKVTIFRALLLGKIIYIDDVVLQFRWHSQSTTAGPTLNMISEYKKRAAGDLHFLQYSGQYIVDASYYLSKNMEKKHQILKAIDAAKMLLRRHLVSYQIMSNFPNLSLKTLWKSIRYPGFYRHFINAILYKCGFYH